ncbi:lytic polysaccharide monooxygenase [Erwinia endophytica]|uniref:lytic polysaccharide monooxygenase n=1 Tax=Erwinia endophytica TaxID=1563158 RepID=UPI00186B9354|nr:lytic polysaccharide monooxygenase [Erwinia endophytica]
MSELSSEIISTRKTDSLLRHGHVFSPASRAYIAWQEGKIDTGMLNQRESGKFFPAWVGGLSDAIAPTDTTNAAPPPDGKIASANQGNGEFLDEAGTHWQKHSVKSAELLKISWYYSAIHLTRRWNYFITREDWDPNLPLSRAQFEDQPFYKVELTEQPFWSNGDALRPPQPTEHEVMLPQRSGYHVLLAVWEVADTGNAFYHVIDLDFVGSENPDEPVVPVAPAGLRASEVTVNSITLTWNAPAIAASSYRLYRDGGLISQSAALTFTDSGLAENTVYSYAVSSVNAAGVESALSQPVSVTTSSTVTPETPPTAPTHLHSMGVTADTVKLMWGPSTSSGTLAGYIVYRDGNEIARTAVSQLTYDDSGLQAETAYRYFVAAFDTQQQLSVPGNVLAVTTLASDDNGAGDDNDDGGQYPQWTLGTYYSTGEKVSYQGKNWICLQVHTAHVPEWAPGVAESLWREIA